MAWAGRPSIWWCSSFERVQSVSASSMDSRARKLIEWFTQALPRRRLLRSAIMVLASNARYRDCGSRSLTIVFHAAPTGGSSKSCGISLAACA